VPADPSACHGEWTLNRLGLLFASLLLACAVDSFAVESFAAGNKPQKPEKEKSSSGPLPSFDNVTKQVQQLLALDPDYQPGDLLTASKAERILTKLDQLHWKVADGREIVKQLLPDGDWMAEKLQASDGREFMRQIAKMPGGYDRVDRLRHMPNGEIHITDFIETPDGSAMIEYMTTTQEGKNLGNFLSADPDGHNFNKPTGRIYTEQEFLKRLKLSYDAEAVRRLDIDPKPSTKKTTTKSTSKSKFATKPKWTRRPPEEPEAEEPMFPPAESPVDSPDALPQE
jgi:hypothetical protein